MQNLTNVIEKYLMPFSVKLQSNKYLNAISRGFSYLMPVLMSGALFTLLGSFNIGPYQAFLKATGLKTFFSFVPSITTDMLAVYTAFFIAKALAGEDMDDKDATIVGMITVVTYFLLVPLTVITAENGRTSTLISLSALGTRGLFTAMIIALIIPSIYNFFLKRNITIKMPDGVPEAISKSFGAIIPAVVIMLIFSAVKMLFTFTPYGDMTSFIYKMIQTPLTSLGASPLTFIVFIVLSQILWFFGLHGGQIVGSLLSVLYMPALMENLAAFQAGETLPNLLTMSTWTNFVTLGGSGATLGLCIYMLLRAKSARYKQLGKLTIVPGLCCINEPVIFGFPMVLNASMIIPFIVTPLVNFILTYVVQLIHLVPYCNGVTVPLGTPVLLSGFLCVGWQGALLQVVLIVIDMILYIPFFNAVDKEAFEEEQKLSAE